VFWVLFLVLLVFKVGLGLGLADFLCCQKPPLMLSKVTFEHVSRLFSFVQGLLGGVWLGGGWVLGSWCLGKPFDGSCLRSL